MSKCIPIDGGFISVAQTHVTCPSCGTVKDCAGVEKKVDADPRGYIYTKCSGCKQVLGISVNMHGDNVCWLKKDEIKKR